MAVDENNPITRFPAIRAQLGDWYYFVTTMPLRELSWRVKPAQELFVAKNLNKWIQRQVIGRRQKDIAEYLLTQDQRFFNALVIGVYQGQPKWWQISLEDNSIMEIEAVDERFGSAIGILELNGEERLYAIDGQHRIAGISEALARLQHPKSGDAEKYAQLANEDITVIFVSADVDNGELERVRRLFSTLNKKARAVTTAELIALDEDEPAAIVTRWLVMNYKDFKKEDTVVVNERKRDVSFVKKVSGTQINDDDHWSVTTMVTLYSIINLCFQKELNEVKKKTSGNRPNEEYLKDLYNRAVGIIDDIRTHVPAFDLVLKSKPKQALAKKQRSISQHLMFRPIGQQIVAGAIGLLISRNYTPEQAVKLVTGVPMDIRSAPWEHIVWDPTDETVVNKFKPLGEALMLRMCGEKPRQPSYDLLGNYQLRIDDDEFELSDLPKSSHLT